MSSSVDLFPPRRPLFFPVVIATVLLTILGMTGGYLLREHYRPSPSEAHGASQPIDVPSSAAPATSKPAVEGTPCPQQIREISQSLGFTSELHQVFYRRYEDKNQVWICADPNNNLFYQGKTGDGPWEEGRNALFLAYVPPRVGDTYIATAQNNGTVVTITPQQLKIFHPSGKGGSTEKHDVVTDGTN